jgi:hypothetical protein
LILEDQIQAFKLDSNFEKIRARRDRRDILARNQTLPPSNLSAFLQFQKRYCRSCGCLAPAEMAADFWGESPRCTVNRPKTRQPSTERERTTGSELKSKWMPALAAEDATRGE